MISGFLLATLNATLNATAAVCLALGFRAVRRKQVETHRRYMLGAFTASAVFLLSYLTRMALYGDTHFTGEGILRIAYFAILVTHVLLATVVLPFVLRTLFLGVKRRVPDHRRIAKLTLPMWAYVSVTGVIVYLMLYHLP